MNDVPHFLQMQSVFFPFLGALIFALAHIYIYKSLLKSLSTKPLPRLAWKIFSFFNALACASYVFLRDVPISPAVYFLLSLALGVCFMLLLATILYQIISLGIMRLKTHSSRSKARNRAKMLAFSISIFVLIYGIYHNHTIETKHISIEIDGLNAPLRAVILSDIHIGGLIERTEVAKIVQKTNALNADMIFLVGDIVDAKTQNVEAAINELGALQSRYGVFFVLGNHEYFHDIDNIISKMRNLGFKVLLNESVVIENSINIAGITDFVGLRFNYLKPNLESALQGLEPLLPTILLSHQPRVAYLLRADLPNDKIALVLSGHTHGGQIFPFGYAMLLQQPFIKGLHTLENLYETKVYVSEGAGFWGPPMRILSTREITAIELLPMR